LSVAGQLEVTDDEPPAAVQIVDDDSPADPPFTASGTWSTWSGGHDGDFHYALAGTGTSVAQWEFWVAPGDYQVSATWFEHSNRATNAPYTVLDGTTPLGTVAMNQRLAPNDFSDAGSSWENLGVFTVSGTSLMVRLSNAANGVVVADAVRIERVATVTVTIADASISENGGSTTGTVTRSGDTGGDLTVGLSSSDTGEAAAPASVVIPDGDASATFSITGVDDSVFDGTQTVTITPSATGYTGVSDTVDVTDDEPVPPVQIVDDDDPADPPFTASGTWSTWSGGHDGDFHYALAGTGSAVAQWEFTVTPGDHLVSATWFEYSNRATDAPYTVLDGGTPLGTVDLNQRLAPDDRTDDGSSWEDLGVFTITGTSLVVQLSNAANGVVVADAIRIEQNPVPTAPAMAAAAAADEVHAEALSRVARSEELGATEELFELYGLVLSRPDPSVGDDNSDETEEAIDLVLQAEDGWLDL
jgi:hypothetical protein